MHTTGLAAATHAGPFVRAWDGIVDFARISKIAHGYLGKGVRPERAFFNGVGAGNHVLLKVLGKAREFRHSSILAPEKLYNEFRRHLVNRQVVWTME
jgi:hypothetical protein